ncbi:MAG: oxalurate catabolism protein HpxZ [Novosphingobium sp.]
MEIDDPSTLAEVTALVERYEIALRDNDVEELDAMFWQSGRAVRYGVGECLYGIEEILAFRKARPGGSPPRRISRMQITTFGRDLATANVEFQRIGGETIGRQSQTWVRLPEGWRIVAAHVSLQGSTH